MLQTLFSYNNNTQKNLVGLINTAYQELLHCRCFWLCQCQYLTVIILPLFFSFCCYPSTPYLFGGLFFWHLKIYITHFFNCVILTIHKLSFSSSLDFVAFVLSFSFIHFRACVFFVCLFWGGGCGRALASYSNSEI